MHHCLSGGWTPPNEERKKHSKGQNEVETIAIQKKNRRRDEASKEGTSTEEMKPWDDRQVMSY